MDPWLEHPSHFSGLHSLLVSYAVEFLQPQLLSRGYFVAPNERVWITESRRDVLPDTGVLTWRPDTTAKSTSVLEADKPLRVKKFRSEFRQPFLEIFDDLHHRLITGIEFISPNNKSKTDGRRLYKKKQSELTAARVNLVEIDLLRRGRHIVSVPKALADSAEDWTYLVCLWRAEHDEEFDLYPIPLKSRLPKIQIPLKPGDEDAVLDLQAVLNRAYDAGPYRVSVDYSKPPPHGRMNSDDLAWADQILREAGLRTAV
jgi:hypothetical protein